MSFVFLDPNGPFPSIPYQWVPELPFIIIGDRKHAFVWQGQEGPIPFPIPFPVPGPVCLPGLTEVGAGRVGSHSGVLNRINLSPHLFRGGAYETSSCSYLAHLEFDCATVDRLHPIGAVPLVF